jgi:ubiquitin C-terminal hydrolase
VVDLFFGMMRKTIECSECHAKNYKWETFNVFKIPCKGTTLQEWFKSELSVTDIEGRDCEPCKMAGKGRQNAQMYSHIWQLPSSLFVAIKRFEAADGRKNAQPTPYDGAPINFADHFAPESTHLSRHYMYECRAIADQHGGQHGGHYSAQMSHPVTNDWWWMDDAMSQQMPGPRFMGSNYVLYFRRKLA